MIESYVTVQSIVLCILGVLAVNGCASPPAPQPVTPVVVPAAAPEQSSTAQSVDPCAKDWKRLKSELISDEVNRGSGFGSAELDADERIAEFRQRFGCP
jgi:hypothetical protein